MRRGEKAAVMKEGCYKEDFRELHADCPVMLELLAGEKRRWADLSGHVFVHDQVCRQVPQAASTKPPS